MTRIKNFFWIFLVLSPLFIFCPPSQNKNNPNPSHPLLIDNEDKLNKQYQNWLDMVFNIATPEEINTFKKLKTENDRNIFIQLFWKQRDPTSGTEENEYQKEIEQRFIYVNRLFGRGSPKPGWKTDKGRIYMILGKPNSMESFTEQPGLFPAEVWYYYGDKKAGLPTYFNLTFFKRHGMGDWVLYDPVADGPASLISGDPIDTSDFSSLYQTIQKQAPSLANPSISMIPNDIPRNYTPSPITNLIMANIYQSPFKTINPFYASDFLKYKGYVHTQSSIDFIDNAHTVLINKDAHFNTYFVHVAVKPKKVSLDFNQDLNKYFVNFYLAVSLKQDDHTLYEYNKNFDFYIEKENIEIVKAGGVVILDSFPILPGDYQLRVFIQNKISQEFSYFDTPVKIPVSTETPFLTMPVLAYKKESIQMNSFMAYRIDQEKISIDPDNIFSSQEIPSIFIGCYNLSPSLKEKGRLDIELKGLKPNSPFKKTLSWPLKDLSIDNDINRIIPISQTKIPSDYYDITIKLVNETGIMINIKNIQFTQSPLNQISRPTEMYTKMILSNSFYYDYILAKQWEQTGNLQQASANFQRSFMQNPGFFEGIKSFCEIELKLNNFQKVIDEIEKIKNDKRFEFDYHFIKGKALAGLKKYSEAINELLQANLINNSDIQLINFIGQTFLKLGNRTEAIKAFSSSLKINPDQPLIQKKITEIEKN